MERGIELCNGEELTILQGEDGIYDGATVFDAALVLLHYLAKANASGKFSFEGKTVLELGAGTGAVGLAAAKLGAYSTLTDLDYGQDLLKLNIVKNFPEEIRCRNIILEWGKQLESSQLSWNGNEIGGKYDYVVASDITYIENTYPLLVKTIADLTDETSKVIISHELRKLHELEFYSLLKENNFNIQRVLPEDLDETYQSPDIAVFIITKIK